MMMQKTLFFIGFPHICKPPRRNFILVTHADGVAAALTAMPALQGRHIEKVAGGPLNIAFLNSFEEKKIVKIAINNNMMHKTLLLIGFST